MLNKFMLNKADLSKVIQAIVEQQKSIIGPLAITQANKVPGVKISGEGNINLESLPEKDVTQLLTQLVKKYEELFGRVSIEVCRDAIKEIKPDIPTKELPPILQ